jgi:hypothetical protein
VQPTAKKRRLPVIVYVLLGVAGALILTCGAGVAWLASSERGKQFLEATRETVEVFEGATSAPGTGELRELGCDDVMVILGSELVGAMKRLGLEVPAEVQQGDLSPGLLIVFCRTDALGSAPPACADLARTYASAVPAPPERFMVMAEQRGRSESGCHGIYSPEGELLQAVSEGR